MNSESKAKIKFTTLMVIILFVIGGNLFYRGSVSCCGSYYLGEDIEAELILLSIFPLLFGVIFSMVDAAYVVGYFLGKRKKTISEV